MKAKNILLFFFLFHIFNSYSQEYKKIVKLLGKYQPLTILYSKDSTQQVVICPNYQARVMTSTFDAKNGKSLGWIDLDYITSQKFDPKFNGYGGEERFWLGPEGGQNALFFNKGDNFEGKNWFAPRIIDTAKFPLLSSTINTAKFTKSFKIKNYQDFVFDCYLEREVKLLELDEIERILSLSISGNIKYVGFRSSNLLTNVGNQEWKPETGLLSIWMLGMFPAKKTTVSLVALKGSDAKFTSNYFGELEITRVKKVDSVLYFKVDGMMRSKIGVDQYNVDNVLGSFDAENSILTILVFKKPSEKSFFVNNLWKIQSDPFDGDVVNIYNDGSKRFFYELEALSPALALKPNESYNHIQHTIHLKGTENELNVVIKKVFGTDIDKIKSVFKN